MFELTREELIKVLPVVVAFMIATLGWVSTYLHRWYFDRKANELARVNSQLRELYGPLYIRLRASNAAWKAFWQKHRPAHGGNSYFGDNNEVTDEEKEIWRHWMINVFEPLNAEAESLLLKNIDLLESDDVPQSFIDALAHIATYKAVMANWEKSDFKTHLSVNSWPSRELMSTVRPEYVKLRARQRKLMNL